ncbi:MAG: LPS export ABC transporter permease LptG [Betaproteobacteria bacterium]|nr:MAG: LPS export ABC transporter permease LptG [Betaproteobacteria bacterium]
MALAEVKRMRTLNKYIAREIASSTLLVLSALLLLWIFYDLLQELGQLKQLNGAQYFILIAATIPSHLYELLPIAALIGTLFALAQLSSNSEYGVMRTSGVSVAQISGVVLGVGLAIATIVFVIGEYAVPRAEQLVQRVKAFSGARPYAARAFQSGHWFKDGNTFINIASVLPDGALRGVRVFEYADSVTLSRSLTAESARFNAGQQWTLEKAVETKFGAGQVTARELPSMSWNTVITPGMLSVLQIAPERLSVEGLWEYIGHLKSNAQDSQRFEVALWGKFFYPLATCVLMLIALPFAQIQQRSGGVGARVFTGILLGLVFIVVNRLFSFLALLYNWPPVLGAMLPGAIFLSAAAYMVWRLERR